MRKLSVTVLISIAILGGGCGHNKFHQGSMPDPGPYMIHFHELDADGDDALTRTEFKQRFPDATADVFEAVDLDGDDIIDHDEWHGFKEAHKNG
ncbi:MAG: hypothetical protein KFF68_10170 [Desulfosarcina sp.]|nr:hypothetical protein [Desulfosarcina sp.]